MNKGQTVNWGSNQTQNHMITKYDAVWQTLVSSTHWSQLLVIKGANSRDCTVHRSSLDNFLSKKFQVTFISQFQTNIHSFAYFKMSHFNQKMAPLSWVQSTVFKKGLGKTNTPVGCDGAHLWCHQERLRQEDHQEFEAYIYRAHYTMSLISKNKTKWLISQTKISSTVPDWQVQNPEFDS